MKENQYPHNYNIREYEGKNSGKLPLQIGTLYCLNVYIDIFVFVTGQLSETP